MKLFLFAGAVFAVFLASMPVRADIVIGVAGPLTGPVAMFGEQMKHGAEQAAADINAAGGINGEKVVLRLEDDACDPKQAVSVANQLLSAGVKFVVGHFCSPAAIPASHVYAEEGVMMVSPSATHPELTDAGLSNVFRVCGRDDQQGEVLGQYILKHFKGKKIAIIHDNTTAIAGQATQVKKTLNDAGVKEVFFQPYQANEKDYSALVSKIKQNGIDVLYLGGFMVEAGMIARQLKDQGVNVQIFGSDALISTQYWEVAGSAAEGTLMSFNPDPRNRPEAASIIANLRKLGFEPEGYTLYTYAAVQAITEGIKRASKADPVKVAELVRKQPVKTVIGDIGFNAKGDVTGNNYVLYRWHEGKYAEAGN